MYKINKNLTVILCLFSCSMFSKNMNWYGLTTLLSQEVECLEWFEQTKTTVNWGYKDLSQEDQDIFNHGENYYKDQEALTRVMQNFSAGFCNYAKDKNIALKYDQEVLTNTLVKMKNYIAVRMYVFSQLLNSEERLSMQPCEYSKNVRAGNSVIAKCGMLLAEELARVNLIDNTVQAKEDASKEFIQKKTEELKRTCE